MAQRRRRLVGKGGVEMFEIRIVQWFDKDGGTWHTAEVRVPEGYDYPPVHEAWGAMHRGFELVEDFLEGEAAE